LWPGSLEQPSIAIPASLRAGRPVVEIVCPTIEPANLISCGPGKTTASWIAALSVHVLVSVPLEAQIPFGAASPASPAVRTLKVAPLAAAGSA
jgi:hypothetical protein